MARKVRGFALALYVLAIVGALGYGATSLFAQPLGCPDDGFQYLGACSSEEQCDLACIGVHGGTAGGKSMGGCCECFIR